MGHESVDRRELGLLLLERAPEQPVGENLFAELAVLLALGLAVVVGSWERRRLERFEVSRQLADLLVQRRDLFLPVDARIVENFVRRPRKLGATSCRVPGSLTLRIVCVPLRYFLFRFFLGGAPAAAAVVCVWASAAAF